MESTFAQYDAAFRELASKENINAVNKDEKIQATVKAIFRCIKKDDDFGNRMRVTKYLELFEKQLKEEWEANLKKAN